MWDWWSNWGWWGGMGIMMIIGMAFMVLFWGGIIWLIIWGVRRMAEPRAYGQATGGRPSPLDIARERYARGEVTKEQFEQLKKDLSER
jgi:putative membrane protein